MLGWQPRDGYHYKVMELAEEWNVSDDFIRDLFRDESEVVRFVRHRPGKRRYIVIRIPTAVAVRVYQASQVGASRTFPRLPTAGTLRAGRFGR